MNKQNIKTIQFKLELDGKGIVNFDSTEQGWIHINNKTSLNPGKKNDNVQYSKKNFYKTIDSEGNEKLDYKVKISSDALKKNMFKDHVISTSPNIMHNDHILYNYISHPISLLRGYLFALRGETLKRKGGLNITDAEQTCNAFTNIEQKSKAQYKKEKDSENINDKSDNTFYLTENVGDIKYLSEGAIDIQSLQLISCDSVLDRYNLDSDKFELFKMFFKMNFGDDDIKLSYNKLKSSSVDIDEYSIMLKDNHIKLMINMLLKDMLKLSIDRRGSYAKTSKLSIRFVDDPLRYTSSNNEDWIQVLSSDHIDELLSELSFYKFYQEMDFEESSKKRKETDELVKLYSKSDKDKKTNNRSKKDNQETE